MDCMTFGGVGIRGGGGWPSTHSISGMSLARHVHGIVGIVHWINHCGIVLSLGSSVLVACVDECVISRIFT